MGDWNFKPLWRSHQTPLRWPVSYRIRFMACRSFFIFFIFSVKGGGWGPELNGKFRYLFIFFNPSLRGGVPKKCRLQCAKCNMQTVIYFCNTQTEICKLKYANWNMQTAICKMQYAKCNMQTAICKLHYAKANCNTQTAICKLPCTLQPVNCNLIYANFNEQTLICRL